MKRHPLTRLLGLLLPLVLLTCFASAAEPADSGFTIQSGILTAYHGKGGAVTIPNGVTEIEANVFRENSAITSVSIPGSVQTIGFSAFENCPNLSAVQFSEGLLTIDRAAFAGCPLKSVSLPDSLLYIGSAAFHHCASLTSVRLSAGTFAEYEAFEKTPWAEKNAAVIETPWPTVGTPGLTEYTTVAPTAQTIENGDFTLRGSIVAAYHGSGGDIVLPDGVTGIGADVFKNNITVTGVTVPQTLRVIGRSAFQGCAALKTVSPLPDNFLCLCRDSFQGCTALTSLDMPIRTQVYDTALRETPYADTNGQPKAQENAFPTIQKYAGQFTDVPSGAWYGAFLTRAYEAGLWEIPADGLFQANGTLSVGESIKLTATIHARAAGKSDRLQSADLQSCLNYLLRYTYLQKEDWQELSRPIRRDEFACLLCNALPYSSWNLHHVGGLETIPFPDVKIVLGEDMFDYNPYSTEILQLYNDGVFAAYEDGKFHPERSISRAEAVVMTARWIDPSLRLPEKNV